MSYIKNLPETDADVKTAMTNTNNQINNVDPEDNIISEANTTEVQAVLPEFIAKEIIKNNCEQAFHSAVNDVNLISYKLGARTSHGFQLVNFQIEDGITGWTPDIRSMYSLPLSGNLPPMNSEGDIRQGGVNFIDGETSRVAAGGVLLVDISKTQVQNLLNQFDGKVVVRQNAKSALLTAQSNFDIVRKKAFALIPKMLGDIEHASQDMEKGAAHEFDILWGMQFKHLPDPGILNVKAEDLDSHQTLPGVELRIGSPKGKGGARAKTNDFGVASIKSTNFDATKLIAKLATHEDAIIDVQLIEGETISVVVKMKKKTL